METCGNCRGNRPDLWFSSYGTNGRADDHDNFMGYDYNSWGMMVGAEYSNSMDMRLGFFYGYGKSDIDGVMSGQDSADHTLGMYGQWNSQFLGGYSLATGSLAFGENDGVNQIGDTSNANSFDSFSGSFLFEKGWTTQGGTLGVLNPYIAVQYLHYNTDDFGDVNTFAVQDNHYDSFRSILGARLTKDFQRLCLTAGLAWHHEFCDENASFPATTANGSQTIFGNGTGRDWAEGTVGLQYTLTERLTLSGDYYLFLNGANTLHAGMGTLILKF